MLAPGIRALGVGATLYRKRYGKELAPTLERARAAVAAGRGGEMLQRVDFLQCSASNVSAATFLSYYGDDEGRNSPAMLAKIAVPVLAIVGSVDRVVGGLPEMLGAMADGKKLRLLTIDGAGHFFRDLYAEDVADAVQELFAEVAGG